MGQERPSANGAAARPDEGVRNGEFRYTDSEYRASASVSGGSMKERPPGSILATYPGLSRNALPPFQRVALACEATPFPLATISLPPAIATAVGYQPVGMKPLAVLWP